MSKSRHWRAMQKRWIIYWSRIMMQNWLRKRGLTNDLIRKNSRKNNPKIINSEELHLFEYTAIARRTQRRYECHQGQLYNRKYPITWKVASNNKRKKVVPSVEPSGDPSSSTWYEPSMDPYGAPIEQKVRYLQWERRTKLEQEKALENIIASGEIKDD